jgi:hypothetical protein
MKQVREVLPILDKNKRYEPKRGTGAQELGDTRGGSDV